MFPGCPIKQYHALVSNLKWVTQDWAFCRNFWVPFIFNLSFSFPADWFPSSVAADQRATRCQGTNLLTSTRTTWDINNTNSYTLQLSVCAKVSIFAACCWFCSSAPWTGFLTPVGWDQKMMTIRQTFLVQMTLMTTWSSQQLGTNHWWSRNISLGSPS